MNQPWLNWQVKQARKPPVNRSICEPGLIPNGIGPGSYLSPIGDE